MDEFLNIQPKLNNSRFFFGGEVSPLRQSFFVKFANNRIILCDVFAKRSSIAQNALVANFTQ